MKVVEYALAGASTHLCKILWTPLLCPPLEGNKTKRKLKYVNNFCTLHPPTTMYATPPPSHGAFKAVLQQKYWIKPRFIFIYYVHLPNIHIQNLTNLIRLHSRLGNDTIWRSQVKSDATKKEKSYLKTICGALGGMKAAIMFADVISSLSVSNRVLL